MKLLFKVCFIILLTISCNPKKQQADTKRNPSKKPEPSKVFDYQPRKPVNGKLYAAIELGALGLNYFIAEIDNQKRWSLKKASYGRSNIIYGINTTDEIISKIATFRKEIVKSGVGEKNIHILASSSAVQAEILSAIKSRLDSKGLNLKSVDVTQEAKYALIATIPQEFVRESFMVDVGSGNTKLSWVDKDDTTSIEIHGSKYFLGDVHDTTVFREVRDALLKIPAKNRNLCFMLGGMIYEFVKDEIDPSDKRYFILKSPGEYPASNEKMKAGNVIYNALYLEPTYSYIFDSQSNFVVGYLISQVNK